MIKAAVLGSPIAHSLSPLLHRRAYQLLGVDGSYEKVEVKSGGLASFLDSARTSDWTGLSLTMPLKEEVVHLDINIDQGARISKSANTIVFSQDGTQMRALSTDKLAFDRLLQVKSDSKIVLLGGGGTARSALNSLNQRVSKVEVFLRSPEKSAALFESAPDCELTISNFAEFDPHSLSSCDYLISTVPAGASDEIALQLGSVSSDFSALNFVEVLYNPWPTDLLTSMRTLGAQCLDGLDLLVEQALDQIALFTMVDFDYAEMRRELLQVGLEELSK